MRTSNPVLNEHVFSAVRGQGLSESMTLQGTVNKCFILLAIIFIGASWVWGKLVTASPLTDFEQNAAQTTAGILPLVMGGFLVGFITAMITIFKKEWAKVTAPIYALCEGLFLGGISALFEMRFPGIVLQAVALTMGTLFCLLAIYKSGLIRVTDNFRLGIFAATGAIALLYLVNIIMGFFGNSIGLMYASSPLGIGFSVVVVIIAALNLVLDFDFIEKGASQGAPKYMEWFAAFGLMVTLIWLYVEILRLLAKLRDRSR